MERKGIERVNGFGHMGGTVGVDVWRTNTRSTDIKEMILLNTELPSLCLNYITVNCLHCYNPDL